MDVRASKYWSIPDHTWKKIELIKESAETNQVNTDMRRPQNKRFSPLGCYQISCLELEKRGVGGERYFKYFFLRLSLLTAFV